MYGRRMCRCAEAVMCAYAQICCIYRRIYRHIYLIYGRCVIKHAAAFLTCMYTFFYYKITTCVHQVICQVCAICVHAFFGFCVSLYTCMLHSCSPFACVLCVCVCVCVYAYVLQADYHVSAAIPNLSFYAGICVGLHDGHAPAPGGSQPLTHAGSRYRLFDCAHSHGRCMVSVCMYVCACNGS